MQILVYIVVYGIYLLRRSMGYEGMYGNKRVTK